MNVSDALGTDIAHVGDLVRTPSGDLARITGLANLYNALFHRLLTTPGSHVAKPGYGVGVLYYQNAIASLGKQQELAGKIKQQFELDVRVVAVLSVAINNNDMQPDQTTIVVSIKPIGYSDFTQMTFLPFAQGL